MKNLLIALAVVLGLCLQSAAAQTTTPPTASEKSKAEVTEKLKAELAKISKELRLTADQDARIKAILTEEFEKMEPVQNEYEQKTLAIKLESRDKMRAVLSPDQQKQLDRMKAMKAEYSRPLEPVKVPK